MPKEKYNATKAPYHNIFLTGDELEPRSFFNEPISGDKTAEIWQELHVRFSKQKSSRDYRFALTDIELALYNAITKRLTHENNVLEVKVSEEFSGMDVTTNDMQKLFYQKESEAGPFLILHNGPHTFRISILNGVQITHLNESVHVEYLPITKPDVKVSVDTTKLKAAVKKITQRMDDLRTNEAWKEFCLSREAGENILGQHAAFVVGIELGKTLGK